MLRRHIPSRIAFSPDCWNTKSWETRNTVHLSFWNSLLFPSATEFLKYYFMLNYLHLAGKVARGL